MEKKLLLWFCIGLLALEVGLGWRYVGGSMLLGDQLDQLLQFAQLLREGKAQALYGPWMSGTNPIAYNFGPIFSMSLGTLSAMGLNPDLCHAFCMIVIAAAVASFTYVLGSGTERERCLAVILAALMVATAAFQESLSFIWVNLWLPSACLLTAASMIACIHRPSVNGVIRTLAVWLLGMHLHSVAVIGLPMVAGAACSVWRARKGAALPKGVKATTWLLLAVACLPYAVAEIWSHLSNAKAMYLHITRHDHPPGHETGLSNALDSLIQTAVVIGLLIKGQTQQLWLWLAGSFATLRIIRGVWKLHHRRETASDYLWLCLPAVLLLQAGYHILVNRQLTSFHYFIYPTLFYWLPWAEIPTTILMALPIKHSPFRFATACLLAAFVALSPLQRLPSVTPEFAFKPMLKAVNSLCSGRGPVRGYNSMGFENGVGLAYHTNVAEFLIKYYSACSFNAHAPTMLVPRLPSQGEFPKTLEADGTIYRFVEALPPRIALYQAIPAAESRGG